MVRMKQSLYLLQWECRISDLFQCKRLKSRYYHRDNEWIQ